MILTMSDVRKAAKSFGFKVKTQSMSWGRACTYVHAGTGHDAMSLLTQLSLKQIGGLLSDEDKQVIASITAFREWLKANNTALKELRESDGITGLTGL